NLQRHSYLLLAIAISDMAAQLRAQADARAVRWHRRNELHGGTPTASRFLRRRHRARQPPRRGEAGAGGPRAAQRRTFYESDCQGRVSSLLIAFSSFPLQSAPSDSRTTNGGASGWAEKSFSAGSSSVPSF